MCSMRVLVRSTPGRTHSAVRAAEQQRTRAPPTARLRGASCAERSALGQLWTAPRAHAMRPCSLARRGGLTRRVPHAAPARRGSLCSVFCPLLTDAPCALHRAPPRPAAPHMRADNLEIIDVWADNLEVRGSAQSEPPPQPFACPLAATIGISPLRLSQQRHTCPRLRAVRRIVVLWQPLRKWALAGGWQSVFRRVGSCAC